MTIQVQINGETQQLAARTTISQLVQRLELQPQQIAIEVNQQLVPRGEHGEHELMAGDCIEIVTLVGGG